MVYYCSEFAPFTRVQAGHILELMASNDDVHLLIYNNALDDETIDQYFAVVNALLDTNLSYTRMQDAMLSSLNRPLYIDGLLRSKLTEALEDAVFLPVEEQYGYELKPFVETFVFDDVDEQMADYIVTERLFGMTDDIARVYAELSYPRFQHTMRVRYLTGVLGDKHGLAVEDAKFAALFHDYAKEQPTDELEQVMRTSFGSYIDAPVPAWHGFVAAKLVSTLYEPVGQESAIYQAIAFHSIGIDNYSEIGLALFIADFCDYRRAFAVETRAVWDVAQIDLYRAAKDKLLHLRTYFAKKQQKLYRTSEAMLAWLLVEIETRE